MSDNSQMETGNNIQSLNNLKSIYQTEKNDLQNMLDNCNNRENELNSENSDLKVENLRLKNDNEQIINDKNAECEQKISQKEEEHTEELNSLKPPLQGGFRKYLNSFENKISGGIIGQLKTKLQQNYNNEIKNFQSLYSNQLKGGSKQTGGNPIVFMIVAVVKIALMTLGTFFFNWWPVMMIISFYCVYVEYKMIKLSGQSVMGLPIIYLLGAYLCPCFWAIGRLGIGYSTNMGTNPNLFNIFSKCTDDGFTLNFYEYYGRDCKDNKCVWTTNECYGALFDKNSGLMNNLGFSDSTNTASLPNLPSLPGLPSFGSTASMIR